MIAGMRIEAYPNRRWEVTNSEELAKALESRDALGGAEFWLAPAGKNFPCLAIRVTGDIADVHFFPKEYHPGFRCFGGDGLPTGGMTTLVYEGCHAGSSEETPNEFVLPFATAVTKADYFLHKEGMSDTSSWFEL